MQQLVLARADGVAQGGTRDGVDGALGDAAGAAAEEDEDEAIAGQSGEA